MLTNITSKLVSTIIPTGKPQEIRDTQLKGLLLRVQPSGVMTYYLEYGRGKRIKLGRADAITPYQARELARAQLAEVYRGDDPTQKKRKLKTITYRQFLDHHYKEHILHSLKTGQATYERLVVSFKEFHDLKLSDLTPLLAEKWRQRRLKDGVKATTINRELADLKACLQKAVLWEIIEKHPLEKFKPCKGDRSPKVRYLTENETLKLYEQLDNRETEIRQEREQYNCWLKARGRSLYPDLSQSTFADHLKPAVIISLHTGLRRGELFSLKWENVDFHRKQLTVVAENAKSGKTRHIPLNSEVFNALRGWKEQTNPINGYVFEGPNGKPFHDVRTSWVGVLTKAEIENFRWHDLRHTFASNLVMAGVSLTVVKELMGHSDYDMTLRYAHLAPEHKSLAVEKLVRQTS